MQPHPKGQRVSVLALWNVLLQCDDAKLSESRLSLPAAGVVLRRGLCGSSA